jgi:hypothetical protein
VKIIKLDTDSPTNPDCRYSIAVDGCTVVIKSSLFPQCTQEFPSRDVALIFAHEFTIEAIEAMDDKGWRSRVKQRLDHMVKMFQPSPVNMGVNGS